MGGLALWGALMAVLSLLPVVGSSLVWLPVAIGLFLTGSHWQAFGLVMFGVLVIGLVDNILRPILVLISKAPCAYFHLHSASAPARSCMQWAIRCAGG